MGSTLQYILYPYLAAAAVLACVAVVVYVRRRYASQTARRLVHLVVLVVGWLLFNTFELVAPTPAETLSWAKLSYLFISLAPVGWLLFALAYVDNAAPVASWRQGFRLPLWSLFLIPALTIGLVITNEWHHLVWRSYNFVPVESYLAMSVDHGPWYLVLAVYSYLLVAWGALSIALHTLQRSTVYRSQSVWLILGALAPLVTNLVYVLDLIPGLVKDYTAVSFAVASIAFAVGIYRHRLFDLRPIARDVAVDHLPVPMFSFDRQKRLVDINAAALSFLARSERSLIGQPIEVVFEDYPLLVEKLGGNLQEMPAGSSIQPGQGEDRIEVTLPHPEGRRSYELQRTLLRGRGGTALGVLALLLEVTERKRTEEALRRRTGELERRNEELDSFAHTVAHDLKAPLALISGYGEMLLEELSKRDDLSDFANAIVESAHNMRDIIESLMLLTSVRQKEIAIEQMDMGRIVDRALGRLAPMAEERGAEIDVAGEWPVVYGYAPWVEAVWVNYLSNALKYGGSPPRLALGADFPQQLAGRQPRHASEIERFKGEVRFWVRDNGPGIAPDEHAQLFQLFTRLDDRNIEGHGMGLSIVKRIANRLGGEVGVESALGEGSTFWFTLPGVADQERLAETRNGRSQAAAAPTEESFGDGHTMDGAGA